jgi:phage baseplate assembly protein gpV
MKSVGGIVQATIEISDIPLGLADSSALEEVWVQHWLSTPSQCELAFRNPAGTLADAAALPAGSPLRVTAHGFSAPLFVGEITAVEYRYDAVHGHEVRLRGYDKLHRLRKQQPVRAHVQVTMLELAREIAGELGLRVESAEDGPLLYRLIQCCESDLDLLTEVAERCGIFLVLREDVLQLVTLEGIGEAIPLSLGDTLLEAKVEINGDRSCRAVSASAWDPWRVERHEGRASTARVGRNVAAQFPPSRFGVTGERILADEVAQDDRQAEAWAQAELDLRAAAEVVLSGTAEGDPRLAAGARVAIRGISPALEGRYVLTRVIHRIDRRTGFVSEFSTDPPAPRPRSRAATAALGIVSHVNDPEDLGRVKVSLPTCGDVETDWMEVLSVGAGRGKGFVMIPDAGDQVLVLFAHDDLAQGIVLGGLYGSGKHPDPGVESGSVRRCALLTPGGQKLQVDDTRKLLRLENSDGSRIEISPEKVLIHSKTRLEMEAIDQPVVIRGRSIDFEKG